MTWEVWKSHGVNHGLINIFKDAYECADAAGRIRELVDTKKLCRKSYSKTVIMNLFIAILERSVDEIVTSLRLNGRGHQAVMPLYGVATMSPFHSASAGYSAAVRSH